MAEKWRGVRQHGDGIEIYWMLNGHRYSETLPLRPNRTNFKRAAKIREQRIAALKYGEYEIEGSPPFHKVAQEYLETMDRARSTVLSYRNLLNQYWIPDLGKLPIGAIRYSQLLALSNAFAWPSGKTRKNALIPLRGVFELALRDGLIADNPAAKLRQQKHQRPPIDPITPEEWEAIRPHLREWTAYFSLIWETGLRHPGEAVALTWDDWRGDRLVIDKAISRRRVKHTKTASSREVLLTAAAQRIIRDLPSRFQGGPLFPNTKGGHQLDGDLPNEAWREAIEKAGVRHRRAYNLRHGWASRALTAGIKPAFVAQQLGHSLQMTYNVYGKWISSDNDRSELAKLERFTADYGTSDVTS